MINAYRGFRELLPESPLIIGTVAAHNPDGTSDVTTLAGGTIRVRGQTVAPGLKAFVRNGLIEGQAPDLPSFNLTVA